MDVKYILLKTVNIELRHETYLFLNYFSIWAMKPISSYGIDIFHGETAIS